MDRRRFIQTFPVAAAGLLSAAPARAADPAYFVAIGDSAVLVSPSRLSSAARTQSLSLAGAVAAATRAEKPLNLLPGAYRTSGFSITRSLEIFAAPGTVVIEPAGGECFNIDIRPLAESSQLEGVTIRGIGFRGKGANFPVGVNPGERPVDPFLDAAIPRFNALITAFRVRKLIVEDCSIGGSEAGGLALWRCRNAAVTRNEFLNNNISIYSARGENNLFADNDIHDNANFGIVVEQWPPGPDYTILRNNRIANTAASFGADPPRGIVGGSGPYGNGVFGLYAHHMRIEGNRISDSAFSGARMNGCCDLQITNNAIDRSGETAIMVECPQTDGKTPNGLGYEGGVIANNIVSGAAEGVSVTNGWYGGRRVSIIGNQVRSIARKSFRTSDPNWPRYATCGDGIYAEADVDIVGNMIENCEGCGIYVAPMAIQNSPIKTAANVTGNIVKNAKWGVGFWKGSDPARGFTFIQGNMISGSSRGAIMALSPSASPNDGTRTEDDGRDYGALKNGLDGDKPYPVVTIGVNDAF
jgi:uncharacterized secreted repeat protein (TIGR03808 family)